MLIYLTFRFKFRYGFAAVLALMHDVIITIGLYALSGKVFTLAIVAALLTIVGYSVNDTIVVCDRIRENINKHREPGASYEGLVNLSINQTLSRTLLTSGTVLIVLIFLFFFGGEVLSGFSFAMLVGVVVGTYSSDCLVSPILVIWYNMQEKYRGKERVKGTDYVKRSLKTLFPDRKGEERSKFGAISGHESSHGTAGESGQVASTFADADTFKKKHLKRKKGITGRKKKRRH
jgi:predicted RND superfamily exporter protein